MVAVLDHERERRAERPPVPEPREHLHLVRLDLLARAAAVALLAPPEIRVDRRAVEDEPRREPGDDRDERRAVRLACRDEAERAHAEERTARRITSMGAESPVQSSNAAAPCASEHLEPVDDGRPRGSRSARRGRLRVGKVDQRLALANLEEHLVAFGRRVHDEVARRGGRAASVPLREKTTASGRASRKATAAPPAPTIAGRSAGSPARIAASVEWPSTRPSETTSVFTDTSSVSQQGRGGQLVGRRHVRAREVELHEPGHRSLERLGPRRQEHVGPVELARPEGRVLHPGRPRPGDRIADQPDEPCEHSSPLRV